MAFDYFGVDPTTPVDTVPLSQLPAFLRDAKRAFNATFISGVEFEAGTVFGDAVYYDKATKKWRRSVWLPGMSFNIDGFAIPQYGGVTTGVLLHGNWMFEGGTELYLSSIEPGKIYPQGTAGIPTPDEGAFFVGKQITPGTILFMPGVSLSKSYAEIAKVSAEQAKLSAEEAKASADEAKLAAEEVRIVVADGIVTIQTAVSTAKLEITTFAEQTIGFVQAVGADQLVIIRNAGAVARRELELVAENTINSVKAFVIQAQNAAGKAEISAGSATASKNAAEQAAHQAITAQQRMQSLNTTAVEGSIPNATYIASSNTIQFTLVRGERGLQGTAAPAGAKGPTGDMGPIPSGAAFGKVFVDTDGMLSFEFLDLGGVIGADTFTIDQDGYLVATDA